MYDINFIKKNIVPESRRKVITAILSATALAVGLTLVSVGTVSVADLRTTQVYASEMNNLREDMESQHPGLPGEEELKAIIGRTEPYLKDIGKMVTGRIQFASLWERIAMAVPDNVWLTRVSIVDPREKVEETYGSSKAFRGMVIEGVALAGSGPEGDQAVGKFVENLESDEELGKFIGGVEFMGTGLEQVGGTSVMGFEISCPF